MKLLAIDMDGTCLNDKKIMSEETLEALRTAAKSGIEVVPATGRTLSCIPNQLKNEKFYRYVISSNGAAVTDTVTGNSIFRAEIPYTDAKTLLENCSKAKILSSVHVKNNFVVQGRFLSGMGHILYGVDALSSICVKDAAAYLKENCSDAEEIQLFFISKAAEKKTKDLLSHYNKLLKSFSDHYVEIYSPDASKGAALAALAGKLGISEIAAIGDAENDLSMFEISTRKFAMGNAIPELKEKADAVLPSNNESGVAYAIRQYLL